MSRPLSAAVVVCAASAEREPLLRACVDSLLEGARRPDEIRVVVDQNPALEASSARLLSRVLSTIAVEPIAAARPRSRVPPIARHLLA
jgi:hypothetical protein